MAPGLDRRRFLQLGGAATVAAAGVATLGSPSFAASTRSDRVLVTRSGKLTLTTVTKPLLAADGRTHYQRADHSHAVERVAPDGSLVWRTGTFGDQPGEFQGIVEATLGDDGLYVLDQPMQRITVLNNKTGRVVRTVSVKEAAPMPRAFAIAPDGHLAVASRMYHKVSILSAKGAKLHEFGARGVSKPADLNGPSGLAFGRDEELYVLDFGNREINVFTEKGKHLRAFRPRARGVNGVSGANDLAVVGNEVLVADPLDFAVHRFNLRGKSLARKELWHDGRRAQPIAIVPTGDAAVAVVVAPLPGAVA
jgi:DNA-binding beta-propeller fold protein YncE